MKRIVIGVLVVTAVAAALAFVLAGGCGPSREERQIVQSINNQKAVADRKGHIETVTLGEKSDDATFHFEAEVLDEAGNPIGKVRGERVEGFGTIVHRYEWKGEPQPPEEPRRRGRRRQPPPEGQQNSRGQPEQPHE